MNPVAKFYGPNLNNNYFLGNLTLKQNYTEITINRQTPLLRELLEYCKRKQRHVNEAEYNGRKVPLNKPMRGDVKKIQGLRHQPKNRKGRKGQFW